MGTDRDLLTVTGNLLTGFGTVTMGILTYLAEHTTIPERALTQGGSPTQDMTPRNSNGFAVPVPESCVTSVPVGSRMFDVTSEVANRFKNFPLRLAQIFLRCVALSRIELVFAKVLLLLADVEL